MKQPARLFAALLLIGVGPLAGQEPLLQQQIDTAVLPLPSTLLGEAGVLRWIGPGQTEQLRKSRNGMSCSVDDPSDDRFDVRCYHDGFWPAIRRARQLRQTLASWEDVAQQLRDEVSLGEMTLPSAPTAGYRMLGPIAAYDPTSQTAGPEIAKWQSIHFPFRTAREMGLAEVKELSEPFSTGLMPYVMASGTWWSHVMIVHEPFE
ncbi:MAG: hypothetical protein KAJ13_11810 [Gemmatimonadetes bacterium]|nr:hypothetical protein [Gemmatimonadota bacterium]